MPKTVLVVDDDALILESLVMILSDMDIEVTTAEQSAAGVQLAIAKDFDLILTDIRMPGMDGSEVVKAIRQVKPEARILVVTAFPGDPAVERAMTAGAVGMMKKPFEVAKILDFINTPSHPELS